MTHHDQLPTEYFQGPRGVSLTDAELREAVEQYLLSKTRAPVQLGQIERMAADDTIFVIKGAA